MSDRLFRALLDAYMCADPHPWDTLVDSVLESELNEAAHERGFDGWVDAYHEFECVLQP